MTFIFFTYGCFFAGRALWLSMMPSAGSYSDGFLLRVKYNKEKCIDCGRCKGVCPMDVDMMDNSRKRLNGTECILCMACVEECPVKALT